MYVQPYHIVLCVMYMYTFTLQEGGSPLYVASREGHCDVVDILLKNGANVDLADKVWRYHTLLL